VVSFINADVSQEGRDGDGGDVGRYPSQKHSPGQERQNKNAHFPLLALLAQQVPKNDGEDSHLPLPRVILVPQRRAARI